MKYSMTNYKNNILEDNVGKIKKIGLQNVPDEAFVIQSYFRKVM